MFSITTYSMFNLEVTFPSLPDLRRLDLVDPMMQGTLSTANLYINASFDSLRKELDSFVSSSNFYNVTGNMELVKELFSQSSWKLDNTEYISSLFQFIIFYYSQLSIDIFFDRKKAENSFFMKNYDRIIDSLLVYEKLINDNIASLFTESMNSLLIYSFIV